MTEHLGPCRAPINACEIFFHERFEQRNVRNFAKMFRDKPDRLIRRHPIETIEAREVHRP